MRTVSRRTVLAGAAAFGSGVLGSSAIAACGTAAGNGPTSAAAPPVSLRITSWLVEQPSLDVYQKELFAPFAQVAPQTTLSQEPMAFSVYPDKIQAYAASGDLPDILEVSYAWFPEWVKIGLLDNQDAALKRDKINPADYDKTVIGMGKWPYDKGPTYSWWTMMSTGCFFYNKSMFDREGLKYPDESWTWDTVVDAAKKLTKAGQQWGLQLASYQEGMLYSFGGDILNADATKCLLDQPGSIKAHQFWADLFRKHQVSPTGQQLKDAGISGDAFIAGKVGMMLHSSYRIGQALRPMIKDFEWDNAPSPKGSAGRAALIAGNPSHALAAAGKHKDRAWEFLRWWATKQNPQQVVLPGNTPTRLAAAKEWVDVQKKVSVPKNIAHVLETTQTYGKRSVTGIRYAEWHDKIWPAAYNAINAGQAPVEQTLKEATTQINRVLAGQ